jgi:5'-nucleotidase
LTLRDVRYELPFPKVVVLIKITGRNILLALNEMLAPHPTPSGSYPHVSAAFRVEFDGSSDLLGSKQKVSAVWHKDQPLEMDRVYKLAVTTFMAAGGDGVTGFATGTIISNDSFPVAELVLRYLRGVQILHPNLRTRVKPMGMFRNNN